MSTLPKRGFYVLKDKPEYLGQKEVIFWSDNIFGPNKYTRNYLDSATNVISAFDAWSKLDINRLRDREILITDFDYYETFELIPVCFNIPFIKVAAPYVKIKGNKLHRSEYFKMYIIQDFLNEKGFDYTKMSDQALLTIIKRYKGWIQVGFPKSLLAIINKIIAENP